jgi:hypothetical protein
MQYPIALNLIRFGTILTSESSRNGLLLDSKPRNISSGKSYNDFYSLLELRYEHRGRFGRQGRAAGMVKVVPNGNPEDDTRLPKFYDAIFEYLKSIGFEVLNL